jgi:hypothetical protein
VALASASSAFSVPASVLVPQGASSASFTITAAKTPTTASGTLSATYAGTTRTTVFTVTPYVVGAAVCRLEEVSAAPTAQQASPVRASRQAISVPGSRRAVRMPDSRAVLPARRYKAK